MRRAVALNIAVLLTLGACGEAANDPVTAEIDELIAAWNGRDADAVRALFGPDFAFNSTSGIDIPLDVFADRVAEGGYFTFERVDDGIENDDGTVTFGIETSNPDSLYPASYTWQVTLQDGRIVHINERRGTG